MKIKDLSITFHTDLIAECVEFYNYYFNAKLAFDSEWYVMIKLEGTPDTPIYLSFQKSCSEYERDSFKGGVTLNLHVENVDNCYEKLASKQIAFTEDITDHDWGDRAFSVQDPIGNIVYVYSDREMAQHYKEAIKEI